MKFTSTFGKLLASWPPAERAVVWLGHHHPHSWLTRSLCYHTGEQACLKRPDKTERTARLSNGALMCLTLDDHQFRHIYFYGTYEPEVTALIQHLAKPGQVWFDVGANIGYYTILLSRLVGPQGWVHAFEPNSVVADYLTQSLVLNDIHNVCLTRAAVSEISGGEVSLYIPVSKTGDSGQSSLLVHESVTHTREVSVPVLSLGAYVDDTGTSPDFMKIDIEGLEILAFRGMDNILTQKPPAVIISEVSHLPGCLATPEELIAYLMDFGYIPYRIREQGLYQYTLGNPLDGQRDFNFAFVQPDAFSLVQALIAPMKTTHGC